MKNRNAFTEPVHISVSGNQIAELVLDLHRVSVLVFVASKAEQGSNARAASEIGKHAALSIFGKGGEQIRVRPKGQSSDFLYETKILVDFVDSFSVPDKR